MAKRVRPAGPGDNVTDETLVEALGACAATYAQLQEDAEVAKTSRAAHSNELKKWKGRGVNLKSLKLAIAERFEDPADVLAFLHNYTRLRALQNMPSIQQDLVAMWSDIELPDETKAEIDRQRWRDDGAFCARQGQPREQNPHALASEAYQQWDQGWLNDQERIAKAMGAGAKPAVDTSRKKPARKAAAKKAEAAPPPANGTRRSRRQSSPMH